MKSSMMLGVGFAMCILSAAPLTATTVPESLRLFGKNYALVHRSQDPSSGVRVTEYAPKGSSPDKWSSLVTIHELPASESPESYIRKVEGAYASSHPGMKFSSGSDNSTGEHWMDAIFVAPASRQEAPVKAVEWNFFRAIPHPAGTRVLQYSERRKYEKNPEEVFSSWDLSSLRKKLLPALLKLPIP